MEKQEVKVVIDIIYPHGVLAANETEITSQLCKELLKIMDDGCLEIPFRICSLESEEIEQVGVFENILIIDNFRRAFFLFEGDEFPGIFGKSNTLK